MSFAILQRRAENILNAAGQKASRPLHARVYEILREFRKVGTPITEINMGMGTWTFDGPRFAVTGDSSQGETGDTASAEDLRDLEARSTWFPAGWKPRHFRLLEELREILYYLTDEPYLTLENFKG